MPDITAEEFLKRRSNGEDFQILDVRESIEFHTYNIGGVHIPLGKLPQLIEDDELDFDKEKEIVVVCQHGLRSKTAKIILQNAGYKNVINLTGGLIKLQRIS